MRIYQKFLKKTLNLIISSKFRYLIFKFIGLNNYISLMLKSIEIKGNLRAKKNILCVERSLFEKDVDELSYRIRKYGWVWLKKSQLTVYQNKLIPKKYRGQMEYLNHLDKIPNEWNECIKKSKILLQRFKDEKKICALLLANLDYWQNYALQVACKDLGIPVIVLQKEYSYNLQHSEYFKDYYKNFTPIADAIMVFGSRMKNCLSQLKGFDEKKIFVTGAPRIDRWRSIESFEKLNDGLLIISFNIKERHSPEEKFYDMVESISSYIKKQNLGEITVKCRSEIESSKLINFCKKEKLNNVNVIYNANIYDLVLQSKVVIGYNSLAVIESMFSKVPIIIPDWFIENKNKKMFDSNDEICSKSLEFCKNKEVLLENVGKFLKKDDSKISNETFEARKKFISNFWEYNPHITACSNVQNVIDRVIKN